MACVLYFVIVTRSSYQTNIAAKNDFSFSIIDNKKTPIVLTFSYNHFYDTLILSSYVYGPIILKRSSFDFEPKIEIQIKKLMR